jgi:hypothetical protein
MNKRLLDALSGGARLGSQCNPAQRPGIGWWLLSWRLVSYVQPTPLIRRRTVLLSGERPPP